MARIKGVQVSATIEPDLNAFLEDHRWDVRRTKAEVVKLAIEQYAERNGYFSPSEDIVEETDPIDADGGEHVVQ